MSKQTPPTIVFGEEEVKPKMKCFQTEDGKTIDLRPDHEWTAAFKHEGEQNGMIIGPVWIADETVYKAAEKKNGSTFWPFGKPIPGVYKCGWSTLRDARKFAKGLGLTLTEE